MKLKFKKYIYFINDITNILLKKNREDARGKNKKLIAALIIVIIILLLSLMLNFYFLPYYSIR